MLQNARIAIGMALLALVMVGCGEPGASSPPPTRPLEPRLIVIDADPHGAVLLDGRDRMFVGLHRDGTVVWRAPFDLHTPVAVRCLDRCPDTVLSGSAASTNSPTVADPAPLFVVDGERQVIHGIERAKREVLTARGIDDFVLATSDDTGRWWIELHQAETVERVEVGGFHTSWQESADGRHALAVTATEGENNEARWFARRNDVWRLMGTAAAVAGVTACVHPDGQRALLVGQRPTVLDQNGEQQPISDLDQAGMCAWASMGGIVVDLTHEVSGARSHLRVFDGAGRVTWQLDVVGEVLVSADPSAPRVAYVALGVLHELDPRSGAELRTVPGVKAARYDGDGSLVVVRSSEDVAWLTIDGVDG